MLDAVYGHMQFQVFEALMRLYISECLLKRRFRCVRWEGLEDGIWACFPDRGHDVVEGFRSAGKKGNGKVPVGWMREDPSDSSAL